MKAVGTGLGHPGENISGGSELRPRMENLEVLRRHGRMSIHVLTEDVFK